MSVSSFTAPRTPQECIAHFGRHVAARDLAALMALYESDAVFVPAPGVVHTGHAEIAAALGQLLALEPQMRAEVAAVHATGDIALVLVDWTLTGTAPGGSAVHQGGRSADVLRRQADGTWRVLIDHP
jgi:uncharacterized protein (TIGR02246 family)